VSRSCNAISKVCSLTTLISSSLNPLQCEESIKRFSRIHRLDAKFVRGTYPLYSSALTRFHDPVAQHTSLSGPSICTRKYVQAYLVNGTLPAEGTVCPVLGPPFNTTGPSIQLREEMVGVVEDRAVVDAIMKLSKRWRISGLF
jgi:hypothetical protein